MGAALKFSDSIRIERPIAEVFTCISNPEWIMEWNDDVLAIELLTSGPCGPGSQQRLILKHGDNKLEVIETTIEFTVPTLMASRSEYIRFIPPTPSEIQAQGLPRINYRYELDNEFKTIFGKTRPIDFTVITLTREGDRTTIFKIIKETEIGGFARVLAKTARLFQRNPMRKQLKLLKARIEGAD